MSVADEVKFKEDAIQNKDDVEMLLDDATHELAHLTNCLSIAAIGE